MTTEYGDPKIAYDNEILRTVVGSGVHGIAIEGTDDHDELGIFIEPPERVIGLAPAMDHYIWHTQDEGEPSGPGDVDRTIYSLRKYLRLAIKGNPTVLLPLFCPESDVLITSELGDHLRELRQHFLSQEAVYRFLGYMEQQRRGITGEYTRVPKRPHLVEKHGYDTKYASHALRLALQGLELAQLGTLELPLRPTHRHKVLRVKRGEVSAQTVLTEIEIIADEIGYQLTSGKSPLPPEPNREVISEWSIMAHERWWEHTQS